MLTTSPGRDATSQGDTVSIQASIVLMKYGLLSVAHMPVKEEME